MLGAGVCVGGVGAEGIQVAGDGVVLACAEFAVTVGAGVDVGVGEELEELIEFDSELLPDWVGLSDKIDSVSSVGECAPMSASLAGCPLSLPTGLPLPTPAGDCASLESCAPLFSGNLAGTFTGTFAGLLSPSSPLLTAAPTPGLPSCPPCAAASPKLHTPLSALLTALEHRGSALSFADNA